MSQNRNEELIQAILDGDSLIDFEPLSNTEAYLKACINKTGTEGLPTPLSRTDVLLLALADVLAEGTPTARSDIAKLVDKTLTTIVETDLAGATEIGDYAFYNLKSLTSIEIPTSVTKICNRAFAYCSSLTSITIPANVLEIENNSFRYCDNLTSVTIEATSITIGSDAFNIGTSNNKYTITMLATTPPTIQVNSFNVSTLNKIIVPIGTSNAYKTATNWSNYANYIVEATA